MINLTHAEIGLIVVEVSVLVLLVIMILLVKRSAQWFPGKGLPAKRPEYTVLGGGKAGELDKWGNLLQESQTISSRLNKNLEEKRELTQSLMKRLDEWKDVHVSGIDHRQPREPEMIDRRMV